MDDNSNICHWKVCQFSLKKWWSRAGFLKKFSSSTVSIFGPPPVSAGPRGIASTTVISNESRV